MEILNYLTTLKWGKDFLSKNKTLKSKREKKKVINLKPYIFLLLLGKNVINESQTTNGLLGKSISSTCGIVQESNSLFNLQRVLKTIKRKSKHPKRKWEEWAEE